ncbi:DUF1659 domain-containing protein [Sporosarcina sp. SG10008]|uniref:DUF1659 domain-containing protein n=1 Tax=Sporosarcina sp. SG10008 TaxID=3373103 RepID=UPI0037DDE1BF
MAGRVYLDGGLTDDGKLIRKSKMYRNIKDNVQADNLYNALEQLAQLSDFPLHRSRNPRNIKSN